MAEDEKSPLDKFKENLAKAQKASAMATLEETQGLALDLLSKVREGHRNLATTNLKDVVDTYGKAVDTKLQLKNHPKLGYLCSAEQDLPADFKKWVEEKVYGHRAAAMKQAAVPEIGNGNIIGGVTDAASDLELMTEDGKRWTTMFDAQSKFAKGTDPEVLKDYIKAEWGFDPNKAIGAAGEDAYKAAVPQLATIALSGKKLTHAGLVKVLAQYLT